MCTIYVDDIQAKVLLETRSIAIIFPYPALRLC